MQQVTPPEIGPARPVQQSFDFNAAPPPPVRSPGPSRLAFRLTRIWKKAWVRRLTLTVLPVAVLTGVGVRAAMDPGVHAYVAGQRTALMDRLSARPEFAIRGARIAGASPALKLKVEEALTLPPGASTLTYDVTAAQEAVNSIPAVRGASVTLAPDGMLDVRVEERHAVALWRDGEDALWLVDIEGVSISQAGARADHPALPLLLGTDAPMAAADAMELLTAAPDLVPRIRAFVRVGQRRWNVALDGDMTILLPEDGAEEALSRVMAWHYGEKVLDRGLINIDMRLPDRPTLRMTPEAHEVRRLRDSLRNATGEET